MPDAVPERSSHRPGHTVFPKLEAAPKTTEKKIAVFTTRIDTIFGATSLQLAPQHPIVAEFAAGDTTLAAQVAALIDQQNKAREAGDIGGIEKHGAFTGHYAINPFSGERVPIWVANYVVRDYGTGAIMAVPAHDERDYEFAKKYDLDIRIVVLPRRTSEPAADGQPEEAMLPYTEEDSILINSGEYNTLGCQEAQQKMAALCRRAWFRQADDDLSSERLGRKPPALLGHADPNALLREGRHRSGARRSASDPACRSRSTITQQGGSPLGNVPEFVNTTCPKCGGPARRETDTMDTFVDSSWYFYRYTSAKNDARAI